MPYLICLVLLFLSWAIPLHFLPWMSWHGEVMAFMAICLLAWQSVIAAKKDAARAMAFPAPVLILMGLQVLIWVQVATGQITFFGDALIYTLYLGASVASLVLGYASINKPDAIASLAKTILIGASFSAIVALTQALDVWESVTWINQMPSLRRPGANLGQPNHLATLLLMGLVSLTFLYEKRVLQASASLLISLILLVGLAATESRTGILSFLVVSIWWLSKRSSLNSRISPWVLALATTIFFACVWFWPGLISYLQIDYGKAAALIDTKPGLRFVVWPQLIDAVMLRPWWGWGIHEVSKAHNAVVDAFPLSEPYGYSHNILLDLALGTGLPIAGFTVLVVGVWLWRRVFAVRELTGWYSVAITAPIVVHSMLEYPYAYAYFLFPLMYFVGVLEGTVGSRRSFTVGVKPVAAALLVLSAIGFWTIYEYLTLEEDFRVARFESAKIGQTPADYVRPRAYLLTQLGALLDGARMTAKPDMPEQEIDLLRKVALRYPWPATQSKYAQALALNGSQTEAVRQMRVIKAMYPEKIYADVKSAWLEVAKTYPQLNDFPLP